MRRHTSLYVHSLQWEPRPTSTRPRVSRSATRRLHRLPALAHPRLDSGQGRCCDRMTTRGGSLPEDRWTVGRLRRSVTGESYSPVTRQTRARNPSSAVARRSQVQWTQSLKISCHAARRMTHDPSIRRAAPSILVQDPVREGTAFPNGPITPALRNKLSATARFSRFPRIASWATKSPSSRPSPHICVEGNDSQAPHRSGERLLAYSSPLRGGQRAPEGGYGPRQPAQSFSYPCDLQSETNLAVHSGRIMVCCANLSLAR